MPAGFHIATIVQARMRSSRLPGKVLRDLAGKPLLEYVTDRVACCRRAGPCIVSTSWERDDDAIEAFCRERGIACHRGPHENVAQRYLETAHAWGLDAFVRICGDSPLIDPRLIDLAAEMLASGRYEIVTNNHRRSFPAGQTVEALRVDAFERGLAQMTDAQDLEHVTRYFYRHADAEHGGFRIFNFMAQEDLRSLRLAVDDEQDFSRVGRIVRSLKRPHWTCSLREIIEHCLVENATA